MATSEDVAQTRYGRQNRWRNSNNKCIRGDEIDTWLKKNKFNGKYVIIDDMNYRQFNDHHRNKLITCDGRVGLTAEDAIRVINIFETKSK